MPPPQPETEFRKLLDEAKTTPLDPKRRALELKVLRQPILDMLNDSVEHMAQAGSIVAKVGYEFLGYFTAILAEPSNDPGQTLLLSFQQKGLLHGMEFLDLMNMIEIARRDAVRLEENSPKEPIKQTGWAITLKL
jgi:hypothetical protein